MSGPVPCVKGSIFNSVVEDVRACLESGRATQDDLADLLEEKDIALMDCVVTAVSWMPAATYGRMLELLARIEGSGRREDYLRRRGALAAERLLSSTYESFDAGEGNWGQRAGELMVGIASVLYDFTRWRFEQKGERHWQIVAEEAAEFPDAAALTAQGFLQWVLDRTSSGRLHAALSRPEPSQLVFDLQGPGGA